MIVYYTLNYETDMVSGEYQALEFDYPTHIDISWWAVPGTLEA